MNCKAKLLTLAGIMLLAAAAQAADPKDTFATVCAKCHGEDGKGQTKMGQRLGCRDYTDAKVQADLKDDAAFKALKEGLKNDDGKTLMKPVDGLSDDDIKGLIAYVRTLKK
jgi:cytochrome c553